jgi:hypothetical protein
VTENRKLILAFSQKNASRYNNFIYDADRDCLLNITGLESCDVAVNPV